MSVYLPRGRGGGAARVNLCRVTESPNPAIFIFHRNSSLGGRESLPSAPGEEPTGMLRVEGVLRSWGCLGGHPNAPWSPVCTPSPPLGDQPSLLSTRCLAHRIWQRHHPQPPPPPRHGTPPGQAAPGVQRQEAKAETPHSPPPALPQFGASTAFTGSGWGSQQLPASHRAAAQAPVPPGPGAQQRRCTDPANR